ncbi:hypothetical protein, partial [Pseudomonas sp. AMR01]|uniref:hypothetical protein n=1 Tax=Pseudomonas sp. AMR01 TaxID=3064904 RepID=UPI0035BED490
GKSEFSKVLGISEREATLAYGEYHRDVERQIALVNSTGEITTSLEHHEHIKSFFRCESACEIDPLGWVMSVQN